MSEPFETVICPWPVLPMPTNAPVLVTSNRPPVIHTVPKVRLLPATISFEDSTLVPPAAVNVPIELPMCATSTSITDKVPLDTVICPTPAKPTSIVPAFAIN